MVALKKRRKSIRLGGRPLRQRLSRVAATHDSVHHPLLGLPPVRNCLPKSLECIPALLSVCFSHTRLETPPVSSNCRCSELAIGIPRNDRHLWYRRSCAKTSGRRREIEPTWASQTAPVSVNKNPPQTVRTIMLKQCPVHWAIRATSPVRDGSKLVNTVVLPPGPAMLATRPLPTGSGG